jgi:hypothetical protein
MGPGGSMGLGGACVRTRLFVRPATALALGCMAGLGAIEANSGARGLWAIAHCHCFGR